MSSEDAKDAKDAKDKPVDVLLLTEPEIEAHRDFQRALVPPYGMYTTRLLDEHVQGMKTATDRLHTMVADLKRIDNTRWYLPDPFVPLWPSTHMAAVAMPTPLWAWSRAVHELAGRYKDTHCAAQEAAVEVLTAVSFASRLQN